MSASSRDPSPTIKLAKHLDASGVDSLWIGESITARPRIDAYALLAAIAAVTETVTLGTAVLLPSLRNPIAFAHQIASLDQLAQGRLILSVGAGFPGPDTESEFAALGTDYRRRVSGVEATLTAARAIWRSSAAGDPAADPTGRFGFDGVSITPPPTAPRVHQRGWRPRHQQVYGDVVNITTAGCRTHPTRPTTESESPRCVQPPKPTLAIRQPSHRACMSPSPSARAPPPQQRLDDYCRAYYGGPSELVGLIPAMIPGTLTQVTGQLSAYLDAGARHIVIRHATLDPATIADEAHQLHDALRSRHG